MDEGANLPALAGGSGGKKSRAGRPKGARNKAASKTVRAKADLFDYLKARAGTTPGQQLADIVMITAKEVKQARVWCEGAREAGGLGLDWKAFDKTELTWAFKAWKTAQLYGTTMGDARAYLAKMAGELMAYVHQRQASVDAPEGDDRAMIEAVPIDPAMMAQMQGNQQLDLGLDGDVTHGPSHI